MADNKIKFYELYEVNGTLLLSTTYARTYQEACGYLAPWLKNNPKRIVKRA